MALICFFSVPASAAVLDVGPSRTYTTIQDAIDAANDADEIIIYEADYAEDVTITNLSLLHIHANGSDRVTVKGMFNLYNATSATWTDNNIIEGIIFDQSSKSSGWCVQHQYARNNEYKHCIFMGNGFGVNGVYGYLQYGLNIARHCTFYGLELPYSNGYASGLHVFDSIIAFNTAQPSNASGYSGVATYSNFYENSLLPVEVGATTGTIFQDPNFVSTDPFSPNFLVLDASSACIGTASDATDMGANPKQPLYFEITVGPGKDYATIQEAVDVAIAGAFITVHAARYEGLVIVDNSLGAAEGITIRTHGDDIVLLVGGIYFYGSSSDIYEGSTVDGFYIDRRGVPGNQWGIYTEYARSNTFKNLVIFGEGGAAGSGAGIYGYLNYGQNIARNCTIYGLVIPYSNGYASGLHVYDSIIAHNSGNAYNYAGYDGVAQYCDFYDNSLGSPGIPASVGVTTGTITVDPQFTSTNLGCSNFLYLDTATSPCVNTAENGSNMGALSDTSDAACQPWPSCSIEPGQGQSLPRIENNEIRVVCSGSISAYSTVALSIKKVGTDTELGDQFTYSLGTTNVTDDTLIAIENGFVLENGSWYHVKQNGWGTVFPDPNMLVDFIDLVVLVGDIDNDLDVDLDDLTDLTSVWQENPSSLPRADLNFFGDEGVDLVDYAALASGYLDIAPENPWVSVDVTEYAGNPVMSSGGEPGTQTIGNLHVCVRKKDAGSNYLMWYTGDVASSTRKIFLATSSDGISWTKNGQVLSDDGHTHMPSVIWDANESLWKMWYTSGSIAYGIHYATSANGVSWTIYGSNPVFAVDSNPVAWDKTSVRSSEVIYDADDSLYKMWYWGNNDDTDPGTYGIHGTGYATSPDGITWTRQGQISDSTRLITGEVLKINGKYFMIHGVGPHIGYSMSLDGIGWDDDPDNPVIMAATEAWNPSYIQAPSIVYDSGANLLRIFYNGADYSLPADGTSIGLATTPFLP